MINPFRNLFQKKTPEKPPKLVIPSSWASSKDYYKPQVNPVQQTIDTTRQQVAAIIRYEEKMKQQLASLNPDIQSILYQVSSIFPEANGFRIIGPSNADLCNPPSPSYDKTTHLASPTGKGYQINLFFDYIEGVVGHDLRQVNLQIDLPDRQLLNETLDPYVFSDIIGGLSYARQICDEWEAQNTQESPTPAPNVQAFPQGRYLMTLRSLRIQTTTNEVISVSPADPFTVLVETGRNSIQEYQKQVNPEDLWDAYEKGLLLFATIPHAQVKVEKPIILHGFEDKTVLFLPKGDTFRTAGSYTSESRVGAILQKPGKNLHVEASELLSALNDRKILLQKG